MEDTKKSIQNTIRGMADEDLADLSTHVADEVERRRDKITMDDLTYENLQDPKFAKRAGEEIARVERLRLERGY